MAITTKRGSLIKWSGRSWAILSATSFGFASIVPGKMVQIPTNGTRAFRHEREYLLT